MTAPPRDNRATVGAPLPVRWDPGRDRRGTSPADRGPRCPVPACPVRYASGDNRLCRMHREDEAGTSPRAQALSRAAPARDPAWPRLRDLNPDERAELDGA